MVMDTRMAMPWRHDDIFDGVRGWRPGLQCNAQRPWSCMGTRVWRAFGVRDDSGVLEVVHVTSHICLPKARHDSALRASGHIERDGNVGSKINERMMYE